MRSRCCTLNKEVQAIATVALTRLAVGGFPALFAVPSATDVVREFVHATSTKTEERNGKETDEMDKWLVDRRKKRHGLNADDVTTSDRVRFMAADDRTQVVRMRLNGNGTDNNNEAVALEMEVVQGVADIESPKPAFEDARLLRQHFRQRRNKLRMQQQHNKQD